MRALLNVTNLFQGRDSSVGIATMLRAGRSGDRIPVEARFSAYVQTGPGAHLASCTMGTGSLQGVKRPGRGTDPPSPPKRQGHERVGLYLYSLSGPSWPVIRRTLPFYLYFYQFILAKLCVQGSRIFLFKNYTYYITKWSSV